MKRQIITIAFGFAAGGFLLNATANVSYEKPPVFQAARILPAKLLKALTTVSDPRCLMTVK